MTVGDKIIIVAGVVGLLVAVRSHWISYSAQQHGLLASYWCLRTGQSAETASYCGQVWPAKLILAEVWRWDWRRYVVYQGVYDTMCYWVAAQLKRSDLDYATFHRELGGKEPEVAAPAPDDHDQPPTHGRN